jgi:hypothetical protein
MRNRIDNSVSISVFTAAGVRFPGSVTTLNLLSFKIGKRGLCDHRAVCRSVSPPLITFEQTCRFSLNSAG